MALDSLDPVFQALAHPARRRILDILKASPGLPVGAVCEHFDMSRIAVMKHLKLLEEAGLVVSEKEGRSRLLYHNTVPIQMIYDRWTSEYSRLWAGRLTGLKYKVEAGVGAGVEAGAETAARKSTRKAKSKTKSKTGSKAGPKPGTKTRAGKSRAESRSTPTAPKRKARRAPSKEEKDG